MAINEIRDPRLEGLKGLKGLEGLNSQEEGIPQAYEAMNPALSRARFANEVASDIQESDINEDIGVVGLGDSVYDSEITLEEQLWDLNNTRGELQPWHHQIFNGVVKGGILAGTTFVSGTLGMVAGLSNATYDAISNPEEASLSRFGGNFWDNPIDQSMQSIEKASEGWLPNYRTNEENDANVIDKMTNPAMLGNLIGDGIIKNIGFSVGAIYSGNVAVGVLGKANKLRQVLRGLNATPVKPMTNALVGSVVSAANEGKKQALMNTTDWKELQSSKINDRINGLADAVKAKYDIDDPEYMSSLMELEDQRDLELKNMNLAAVDMGNKDLLTNMAILSASNFNTFGRFFSGGYRTGSVAGQLKRIADGKLGLRSKALAYTKAVAQNPLSEGLEEVSQGVSGKWWGNYYEDELGSFNAAKKDYDSQLSVNKTLNALGQAFSETMQDKHTAEEFAIGAITGIMGIPAFRSSTKADGTKQLPIYLTGGIKEDIADVRANRAEAQKAADYMNKTLEDPKTVDYIQGLIRNRHYQRIMDDAIELKDAFGYNNASHAQLLSDVMTAESTGTLDDYLALVETAFSTEKGNVEALIKTMTTTDPNTNVNTGMFVKDDGTIMNTEEATEVITKTKNEILNKINDFKESKSLIDNATQGMLEPEVTQELVHMHTSLKDWDARSASMLDGIAGDLEDISTLMENATTGLTKEDEKAEKQAKTLHALVNSVRSGQTTIRELLSKNIDFNTVLDVIKQSPLVNPLTIKNLQTTLVDLDKMSSGYQAYLNRLKGALADDRKIKKDLDKKDELLVDSTRKKNTKNAYQEFKTLISEKGASVKEALTTVADKYNTTPTALGRLFEKGGVKAARLSREKEDTVQSAVEAAEQLSTNDVTETFLNDLLVKLSLRANTKKEYLKTLSDFPHIFELLDDANVDPTIITEAAKQDIIATYFKIVQYLKGKSTLEESAIPTVALSAEKLEEYIKKVEQTPQPTPAQASTTPEANSANPTPVANPAPAANTASPRVVNPSTGPLLTTEGMTKLEIAQAILDRRLRPDGTVIPQQQAPEAQQAPEVQPQESAPEASTSPIAQQVESAPEESAPVVQVEPDTETSQKPAEQPKTNMGGLLEQAEARAEAARKRKEKLLEGADPNPQTVEISDRGVELINALINDNKMLAAEVEEVLAEEEATPEVTNQPVEEAPAELPTPTADGMVEESSSIAPRQPEGATAPKPSIKDAPIIAYVGAFNTETGGFYSTSSSYKENKSRFVIKEFNNEYIVEVTPETHNAILEEESFIADGANIIKRGRGTMRYVKTTKPGKAYRNATGQWILSQKPEVTFSDAPITDKVEVEASTPRITETPSTLPTPSAENTVAGSSSVTPSQSEVATALKPSTKDAPVVAYTGPINANDNTFRTAKSSFEAGVTHFVIKRVNDEHIIEVAPEAHSLVLQEASFIEDGVAIVQQGSGTHRYIKTTKPGKVFKNSQGKWQMTQKPTVVFSDAPIADEVEAEKEVKPTGDVTIIEVPATTKPTITDDTREGNSAINEEVSVAHNNTNTNIETPRTNQYNPVIPEKSLNMTNPQHNDYKDFRDFVSVELDHGRDFSALYRHLSSQGAFSYVNSGRLKEGDTIYFGMDPLSGVSDNYPPPLFMYVRVEDRIGYPYYQVVGSLPSSPAKLQQYEGLTELYNEVKDAFESSDPEGSIVFSKHTSKVTGVMPGYLMNSEHMNTVDPELHGYKDSKSKKPTIFMTVHNGEIISNVPIEDMDRIRGLEKVMAKEGRVYMLIKDAKGNLLPIYMKSKTIKRDPSKTNAEGNPELHRVNQRIVDGFKHIIDAAIDGNDVIFQDAIKALNELTNINKFHIAITQFNNGPRKLNFYRTDADGKKTYDKSFMLDTAKVSEEATPSGIDNINEYIEKRSVEDVLRAVMEEVPYMDLLYKASHSKMRNAETMDDLIASEVFESSIASASVANAFFYVDAVSPNGVKASTTTKAKETTLSTPGISGVASEAFEPVMIEDNVGETKGVDESLTTEQRSNADLAKGLENTATRVTSDDYVPESFEDIDFRENVEEDPNYEVWDEAKETKWLDKVFPEIRDQRRLSIHQGLINIGNTGKTAFGHFRKGIITIASNAEVGTLYHEAFHYVMKSLFNATERTEVLQEATKKFGTTNERLLEEALAEEFRMFTILQEDTSFKGAIKRAYTRILDFINAVMGNPNVLNNYYRDINNGKYTKVVREANNTSEALTESTKDESLSSPTGVSYAKFRADNKISYSELSQETKQNLRNAKVTSKDFNELTESEKDRLLYCFG